MIILSTTYSDQNGLMSPLGTQEEEEEEDPLGTQEEEEELIRPINNYGKTVT